MSKDKKYCERCGTEMESGPVNIMEDNPEPYPQGSTREYVCPKCGAKKVEENIDESKRPTV
jgi:hypothetical protein